MIVTTLASELARHDTTVIVLLGENRVYTIGDVAYRIYGYSHLSCHDKTTQGWPVTWQNGHWQETQLSQPIRVSLERMVTVLARGHSAY